MQLVGPNKYRISKQGKMRVEGVVYLNRVLFEQFKESEALKQLADAASLPGVVGPVIGMPDIHAGFGLPIGGVMASDAEEGIISAGAVGMDINCGVRLLMTRIPADDLRSKDLLQLIRHIEERVPSGVGRKTRHPDLRERVEEVLQGGAPAVIDRGYGRKEDLGTIEENGSVGGADPDKLSREARNRSDQLSTIGGGNHFIEIGRVDEIYDVKTARAFGLAKGCLSVLIHTGSRGLGHQICTDYTKLMARAATKYGIELPSNGLACVPIDSREGRDYYAAMACAVNFAFANRQVITHDIRLAFGDMFACDSDSLGLNIVYDVCHNIAKFENLDGCSLLVHRKGAVRALPPGHPLLPERFTATGNPVLVPGSMGTASYVIVATERARETFYSVNHGAGRVMSRTAARKNFSVGQLRESLGEVILSARDQRKLLDESPAAYKDVHEVVETLVEIGLTRKVARLVPLAVIKGED